MQSEDAKETYRNKTNKELAIAMFAAVPLDMRQKTEILIVHFLLWTTKVGSL